MKSNQGFTLIEAVLAMAILGIAMSMAVTYMVQSRESFGAIDRTATLEQVMQLTIGEVNSVEWKKVGNETLPDETICFYRKYNGKTGELILAEGGELQETPGISEFKCRIDEALDSGDDDDDDDDSTPEEEDTEIQVVIRMITDDALIQELHDGLNFLPDVDNADHKTLNLPKYSSGLRYFHVIGSAPRLNRDPVVRKVVVFRRAKL